MPEVLHLRAPAAPEGASARRGTGLGHLARIPRGNVAAFRAALAVVGLAVIDDAFVNPEPGSGPATTSSAGSCHSPSSWPLIAAANRLPSLLLGWLAIFTGALALTAGITDGVRHILVDRLSGDDVTAVLGGLAGIVLLLLGIAVLWRTRRRDHRLLRRGAIGVAVLASSS